YATNKEEAEEVMNDGFLKIFTKLHLYDSRKPFQMWLRRIMINTSIDYYRRRNADVQHLDVNQALKVQAPSDTLEGISAQEILKLVQELPPAYRMVFNLYAIEGYKHEEIANKLGIHIGTSKSNLSKARKYLQRLLKNQTVD
ncbi:MAG: RNA polymerase sigma factor, partial [Bacteroidota bacterium]